MESNGVQKKRKKKRLNPEGQFYVTAQAALIVKSRVSGVLSRFDSADSWSSAAPLSPVCLCGYLGLAEPRGVKTPEKEAENGRAVGVQLRHGGPGHGASSRGGPSQTGRAGAGVIRG